MTDDGDQELLAAWKGGDVRAGDRLFTRHFRAIDRFFRNKVSEGDIADLAQRTFMACVERPDGYRGEAGFRAYLLGVARNLLREHYRANARARHQDVDSLSVIDLGAGPSTLIGKKEEQRILLAALRSIPLESQVILELHFWEHMTGLEIAAVLGIGVETARTRLRRARLRVGEALERLTTSQALLESTLGDLDAWAQSIRPASAAPPK